MTALPGAAARQSTLPLSTSLPGGDNTVSKPQENASDQLKHEPLHEYGGGSASDSRQQDTPSVVPPSVPTSINFEAARVLLQIVRKAYARRVESQE